MTRSRVNPDPLEESQNFAGHRVRPPSDPASPLGLIRPGRSIPSFGSIEKIAAPLKRVRSGTVAFSLLPSKSIRWTSDSTMYR